MVKVIVVNNDTNRIIAGFTSPTVPRVGEQIHCPSLGLYTVKRVTYKVSDDRLGEDGNYYACKDEVLCVEIQVRGWRYGD